MIGYSPMTKFCCFICRFKSQIITLPVAKLTMAINLTIFFTISYSKQNLFRVFIGFDSLDTSQDIFP